MKNDKQSTAGVTLVELILSMAIIGMIVVAFMAIFVASAKNNVKSQLTLDSTYLGKDAMEFAYDLSLTVAYADLETKLIECGYIKDGAVNAYGYEYADKKYLRLEFSKDNDLVRVIAKIFIDKSMDELQVQYESLYLWTRGGS